LSSMESDFIKRDAMCGKGSDFDFDFAVLANAEINKLTLKY